MRPRGSHNRIPRPDSARRRMWRAMRVMRRFSIPDIMRTAEARRGNVDLYLRALARAGYLAVDAPRQSGRRGGYTVYRLVRDSGPLALRVHTDGSVFDPNEQHK